jgi:glycosyltransferase involved in cell wall biosynthesis
MRFWMRHFEKGMGEVLDGIFVASTGLKELLVINGIAPANKVHVVGLPFDSEEVMERMPGWYQQFKTGGTGADYTDRKNQVVFSSRWDDEKNPDFFCEVASRLLTQGHDIDFVVCSSAPKIRSNSQRLMSALDYMRQHFPKNFIVRENLTKEEYYQILCESKIQFNCANQDWVSFTLLEASVAGCYPIYPYFRSFPETLRHKNEFLYQHTDAVSAMASIQDVVIGDDLWTAEKIKERSWIHDRYDLTWQRMLYYMNVPFKVDNPLGKGEKLHLYENYR